MKGRDSSPEFHPQAIIRDWGNGQGFRLADALTGVCVFGATGSGKTSGPAKHLAYGYLAAGFGGLVLCAKKEERRQWEKWAADTGRTDDLVIIDASAKWRFNFIDWEASRPEEGGGLSINIVNLLDEIAAAVGGGNPSDKSGSSKFWEDALHHLNTNVVDLVLLSKMPMTLGLMRSAVITGPYSQAQLENEEWQRTSICASLLKEAQKHSAEASAAIQADFEECRAYWTQEFPNLNEKTRSIITLTFSMLIRPFVTRPLRKLFAEDTNVRPEDTFAGKIIIVDLPIQEFRLVGRVANLAWKYCFQIAVLRRMQPQDRKTFLRPVFLWADEAQNFVTRFDAEYQAVARSAGGCTVYLTQNRESYRRVLGNNDAVDSLLGNLQAKFFCQNSGDTNEWASMLLGKRWLNINSTSVSQSQNNSTALQGQRLNEGGNFSSGVNRSEQQRNFVETSTFTTLKRGGALHDYKVQAIVYNGGHLFDGPGGPMPYRLLTFDQR